MGFQKELIDGKHLKVQIVGLTFRPGLDTKETFETALNLDPTALCAALVCQQDSEQVKRDWHDEAGRRLLLLQAEARECVDMALDLLATLPDGPLAILLANVPASQGWRSLLGKRQHDDFIQRLKSSRKDIQVLMHDPSWTVRLPRIR